MAVCKVQFVVFEEFKSVFLHQITCLWETMLLLLNHNLQQRSIPEGQERQEFALQCVSTLH